MGLKRLDVDGVPVFHLSEAKDREARKGEGFKMKGGFSLEGTEMSATGL
jgi:hypothetical protein